jgi:hypothetical protein
MFPVKARDALPKFTAWPEIGQLRKDRSSRVHPPALSVRKGGKTGPTMIAI